MCPRRKKETKKGRKKAKQAQTHKQTNPNKLPKNSGKINSNRLSSTFTRGLTMKLLFPIKYVFVYQKSILHLMALLQSLLKSLNLVSSFILQVKILRYSQLLHKKQINKYYLRLYNFTV